MITLGSLFDGAGTAPFAAQQYGVKTLWTSEIEPFPLRVGEKHFPEAVQLGDVSAVDGPKSSPLTSLCLALPCIMYVLQGVVQTLTMRRLEAMLE